MNRRQFLTGSVAATASLLAKVPTHNQKSARIGISTWSFHNLFTPTHDKDAPPISGTPMDARDFPDMIADRYHVHEMEIVAPHISPEPSYIRDLKARLNRAHSHLVNIPVDIKELWSAGGLSDTDAKVREKAISACTKWIDIAHELGARSVRCDPGKINTADLAPTISSYKALASYGASKNIFVIIENHGGVGSEHPEELVELFKGVGKNCGALPDFGNFPDEATRQKGLKLLFPYGRTVCHAKGLKFDDKGNETMFDFAQCVRTSKAAGFKGIYSIEFEGEGDPYTGVQHVVDELLRYL
ncbi:MAG TPA: TIM barrel protein [Bryobacteraceae bacterium]|jgi:sugar phosphate isomerase/epimerase|nr:TIM barrel protein [Bryobacteraceae bacterium]